MEFRITWIALLLITLSTFKIEGLKCTQCGPDPSEEKDDPAGYICNEEFPPVASVECDEVLKNCGKGEICTPVCAIGYDAGTGSTTRRCNLEKDGDWGQTNVCKIFQDLDNDGNGTESDFIVCRCDKDNCNGKSALELVKEFPVIQALDYEVPKCYECGPNPDVDNEHIYYNACNEEFGPVLVDCEKRIDCKQGKTCVAACSVGFSEDSGVTIRSCVNNAHVDYGENECYLWSYTESTGKNISVKSCTCNTDYCNGKSVDELLEEFPLT